MTQSPTPSTQPALSESDYRPATWFGEFKGHHFLIGLGLFFGLIFAMNGMMAYMAISTFDGQENQVTNRNARNFSEVQKNAEAQLALGWQVRSQHTVFTENGSDQLKLTARFLDETNAPILNAGIVATLWHPTSRKHDVSGAMKETAPGIYEVILPLPRRGNWDLHYVVTGATGERFSNKSRLFLSPKAN